MLKLSKNGLEHRFPLTRLPLSPALSPGPSHPFLLTSLFSGSFFPVGRERALMTAPSSADYSRGFGGRYGVEKDKRDKAALGYDYKGETEKHESQRGKSGRDRREVTAHHGTCHFLAFFPLFRGADVQWRWQVKNSKCMCWGGREGGANQKGWEGNREVRSRTEKGAGEKGPLRKGWRQLVMTRVRFGCYSQRPLSSQDREVSFLSGTHRGWLEGCPYFFLALPLHFLLFCHFFLFMFSNSQLSPLHSLSGFFVHLCLSLCSDSHTSPSVSLFFTFLSSGLSFHCSLLPPISSILTPV